MNNTNDHLIPDVVKDIAKKLANGSEQDKFVAEGRLAAIQTFVNGVLKTFGRK